jgi:hypothetical protein
VLSSLPTTAGNVKKFLLIASYNLSPDLDLLVRGMDTRIQI